MASIELKNVTVDLPIYGAHNMNLKGRVANFLARRDTEVEVIRALNDISLSIEDGDRIGILGANGSGKTTLLRVVSGILRPTVGEVLIHGTVVSMIDSALGMNPQCTGIENIFRRGIFLNQSTQQMQRRVDDIVEFSGLGDRIRHPLYTYSSGMRARLAFSIATSVIPEILIIDEGLGTADHDFMQSAKNRLNGLMLKSNIVIVASHSDEVIRSLTSKRVELEGGKIVAPIFD